MRSWRPILFAFLLIVACTDDVQEPVLQLANQHTGGQPGWQWSNPRPQGNELNDVSFHDNVGFAVGVFGAIVRTLDGGLNWTLQPSGVIDPLFGVATVDARTAIAVGSNGTILRTNNRGATWERRQSGVTAGLTDVAFADANHGIAVGHGPVLRTSDGGLTWASSDFDGYIQAVCMVNADLAFAVGGINVYTTVDGGITWSVKEEPSCCDALNGVCFTDAVTGTAVGDLGLVLRTTDGGVTWTEQSSGTQVSLRGVSFTDSDHGVVVGAITTAIGPAVLRTSDGGATWTYEYPFAPVAHVRPQFQAVTMLDASRVIAVGLSGNILRSTDGGQSWEDRTQAPVLLRLFGVSFGNADDGVAVGLGDILRTTDGGVTWERRSEDLLTLWDVAYSSANNVVAVGHQYLPPSLDIVMRSTDGGATWTALTGVGGRAIDFADALTGTIVGGATIFHTLDGGASWLAQQSGSAENLNDVSMLNGDIGIAVGDKTAILRTTNGGAFWQTQPHPELDANLVAVDFADPYVGFIVGNSRTPPFSKIILRTTDAGVTWIKQESGATEGLLDVVCVDRSSAVILMRTRVLETTDGGGHWTPSEPFNALTIPYAIAVSGKKTVTMVGELGVILQNHHIFQ